MTGHRSGAPCTPTMAFPMAEHETQLFHRSSSDRRPYA